MEDCQHTAPSLLHTCRVTIMSKLAYLFCLVLIALNLVDHQTRAQDDDECSDLSCVECLEDDANYCGFWQTNGGCASECLIQDASCFTVDTFPDSTIQETCQAATNEQADATRCGSKTSCEECINTTLTDSSTITCQWFESENYCASGCSMDGCGETTCSDSCVGLSCQDCLDDSSSLSCAWISLAGCTSECSVIDTTCFLASDYDAAQVCNDVDAAAEPTSGGSAGLSGNGMIVGGLVMVSSAITILC